MKKLVYQPLGVVVRNHGPVLYWGGGVALEYRQFHDHHVEHGPKEEGDCFRAALPVLKRVPLDSRTDAVRFESHCSASCGIERGVATLSTRRNRFGMIEGSRKVVV